MRRTIISLALVCASVSVASAQEFRPIPNPPASKPLAETLRAAGNFKTFLSLLERAGLKNLGLVPAGGKTNPAQAGPGGGPRYQTLFAPTDAAFAKLPPGALDTLKKDPARLRSFLLAHMVEGKVLVADLLTPVGDGTSKTFTELKSRQGRVLGFQCNGHTGLHQPRVNGRARVGKFQDVMASDYLVVIHEVDAVLFGDGSV
ncbi:MAG: fasciclin domain-containing protein [Pyrinomonadaceae bacterium]